MVRCLLLGHKKPDRKTDFYIMLVAHPEDNMAMVFDVCGRCDSLFVSMRIPKPKGTMPVKEGKKPE